MFLDITTKKMSTPHTRCCNLIGYFFIGIFIAALVALPVGIGIFVSYNNGKLGEHELHRSGYICGTEPPTKEEIAARNDPPIYQPVSSQKNPYVFKPVNLTNQQSGAMKYAHCFFGGVHVTNAELLGEYSMKLTTIKAGINGLPRHNLTILRSLHKMDGYVVIRAMKSG